MSRRAALIVLAYAVLPFAGFLNENRQEGLEPHQLLPYFAVVLAPTLLIVGVASVVRGRDAAERIAVAIAAALFLFFNFHNLAKALARVRVDGFHLELWVAMLVVGVTLAYMLGRHVVVRRYVLVVGAVLAALPIAQYAAFRLTNVSQAETVEDTGSVPRAVRAANLPNVYFFVLDAYARNDQLREHLDFENRGFSRALSESGFRVAGRAFASYPASHLSISSTLDMRYLVTRDGEADRGDRFYERLRGSNAVVREFKRLGYRYVLAPPGGWRGTECSGIEDLCVDPISGPGLLGSLRELDWAVLDLTPLATAARRWVRSGLAGPYNEPGHVLDAIDKHRVREPYFVFSHMMNPHPPYRYEPDCRIKDADAGDLQTRDKDGYLDNLRCANKLMLAAVDRISRQDPDAVEIIQGDHGSGFTIDLDQTASTWSHGQMRERFPTLNALRLPVRCRDSLHDTMPVINTFPRVFGCLKGENPRLLEPEAYVYTRNGTDVARVPDAVLGGGSPLRP